MRGESCAWVLLDFLIDILNRYHVLLPNHALRREIYLLL